MKLTPRPAAALMLALAATLAFAASAQALPDPAPGHPGVPQTATIVYQEDFTSGTPTVAGTTTPVNIENYAGGAMADNVSYTAGTDWTSNFGGCNGWILTPNSTAPTVAQDAGCTIHGTVSGGADGNGNPQSAWWFLQQLARAVGEAQNPGSGGAGSVVVASFTNAGKNQTSTLQMLSSPVLTASGAPVVQVGHYYAVSVWFGQVHCQAPGHAAWHDSQEVLSLVGTKLDGTPWQSNISDQPLDPCGGPLITLANNTPAHVVNLTTTALLIPADVDTTTVRVRVDNMQLSYQGNDVAFDLPTLTEVTPQLDKSFGTATAGPVSSTDTVGADSTSSVTFTITNASDLQEAGHPDGTGGVIDGWKFSDDLPAGVTVNGPATTTCQAATIAAPVGGSSIVVTDGSIALGAASCTITVPVKATTTSTAPATYKNNPPTPATVDGKVIDVFGLLAPSEADLDVPSPALTLVKSASKTQVSDADETIVYTFQVTNSGDLTVSGITVADPGPITGTGTLTNAAGTAATSCTPTPSTLTPGQTGTCTLTYTVTQTDIDDEYDLVNVAQASGVDPSGNTVTSNQDTKAVTVVQQPALRLAKAGSTTTVSGAGNTVTYTFTATNPGDTTLTGVTVNDPGPAGGTGTMSATSCIVTPSTLGPDDSGTCTLTYTVSQADMDAGAALVNTAQATGLDPDDVPIYSNQPSFTVTPVRSPVLGLVKTVDPDVVGR
ncbi:MAG: DUF11 domain-containing protein, partial [Actinomycetia bacterium]|nr:DUF11 domain-containing protein [Actinomycetes bacterium]